MAKEKPCVLVGTKARMNKYLKEDYDGKKFKVSSLKKSDKNYDIDRKKGKWCLRRK